MNSFFTQDFLLLMLIISVLTGMVLAFYYNRIQRNFRPKNNTSKYAYYLAVMIITTLTFTLTLFMKFKQTNSAELEGKLIQRHLEMENLELRKKIEYTNNSIDSIFSNIIKRDSIKIKSTDNHELNKLELRISKAELDLESQKEITTSLRQAINPINPDEVLTIARLKDEVTELNKSISSLNENTKVRQQNFEDSIKREISSSNNSTTLILVVLIPLVLNFLYTVWKDFKKPEKEKEERSEKKVVVQKE